MDDGGRRGQPVYSALNDRQNHDYETPPGEDSGSRGAYATAYPVQSGGGASRSQPQVYDALDRAKNGDTTRTVLGKT